MSSARNILITAALITWPIMAVATTIEINPFKDNTLYESSVEPISNGAGQYLFAGRVNQQGNTLLRRAVLQFDLNNIPTGSIINQASLELTVSRTIANSTVTLHLAESDWGEGTSDAFGEEGMGAPATLNDATWVSAFNGDDKVGGISWNSVGGDFSASASASAAVTTTETIAFEGPNLLADVQNWFSETQSNYGWFIIGDESTAGSAVRFNSRENIVNQPKLTIDFTAPNLIFIDGFEQPNN